MSGLGSRPRRAVRSRRRSRLSWTDGWRPSAAGWRPTPRRAPSFASSPTLPDAARDLTEVQRAFLSTLADRAEDERPSSGEAWQALIFRTAVDQQTGSNRAGVRAAVRGVPGPAQRSPGRLAPGEPRERVCHRPASRGRRRSGGARMSVGVQRLREEPERIRQGAIDKREDPSIVDRALAVDATRRHLQSESDGLKAERNTASKQIGEAIRSGAKPDGPEVADLRAASTRAGERIGEIDAELAAAEAELEELLLRIPNPADPEVPVGGEEANVTVRTWGEPTANEQPRHRRQRLGTPPALGDRRGARHHRQRARRQDHGLRVPGLQGPGLASAAIADLLVPRRPHDARTGSPRSGLPPSSTPRPRAGPARSRTRKTRCTSSPATTCTWFPQPRSRSRTSTATRSSRPPTCRSATPPTARASGARPARRARTPAGSCASTSSTRWRWSCSRSPTTAPRHWSG